MALHSEFTLGRVGGLKCGRPYYPLTHLLVQGSPGSSFTGDVLKNLNRTVSRSKIG